jgi:hypothetical protein
MALALGRLGSLARSLGLPLSTGYLPKPSGWPSRIPWRPMRFYGPFRFPEFSAITITLNASSTASFNFNSFFSNHPDADKFKQFFPGSTLPSTIVPDQEDPPGQMPTGDGVGAMTARLDQVDYTSRYGGSVELKFTVHRNCGYNLRQGTLAWDLEGVDFRIYVNPTTTGLNQTLNASGSGNVTCEVDAREAAAYQLSLQGNNVKSIVAIDDVHEAELRTALHSVAQSLSSALAQDARRFVYGFLYSQFPDVTGPGMIVSSVRISDGELDLVTHKGIPVVAVRFCAIDTWGVQVASLPDTWGHAEHRLTLSSQHVYKDQILPGPQAKTFDVEPHGDTPWVFAGAWTLDESAQVGTIQMSISGAEVDVLSPDDPFGTVTMELALDHAQLQAAHNAKQYGVLEWILYLPTSDYESEGGVFFCVWVNVLLMLR